MSHPRPNRSPASEALIEMRGVTCGYGDRAILENVDISLPRGKVIGVMGTSGGGKTTLLRLIGRQLSPLSGQVLFDGIDLAGLDRKGLYDLRRRMGMLFQFGALFTDLSVFDNVAFPLREHTDLSESMIRDMVLMKLDAVGLRGARHLMPSEVSGGMARRVALARAIVLDPDLIMYDEPFAGLDPISLGSASRLALSGSSASHCAQADCRNSTYRGLWMRVSALSSKACGSRITPSFLVCNSASTKSARAGTSKHGTSSPRNISTRPWCRAWWRL